VFAISSHSQLPPIQVQDESAEADVPLFRQVSNIQELVLDGLSYSMKSALPGHKDLAGVRKSTVDEKAESADLFKNIEELEINLFSSAETFLCLHPSTSGVLIWPHLRVLAIEIETSASVAIGKTEEALQGLVKIGRECGYWERVYLWRKFT
jgi:hypothetical protein